MRTFLAALIMAAGYAVGAEARAESTIIDQSHVILVTHLSNATIFAPLGQTFTPTLSGLNFVTIKLGAGLSPFEGAIAAIEIRTGVNGALVGTSKPTTIPASQFDMRLTDYRFDFAQTAVLTPGGLYSWTVKPISGMVMVGGSEADYERGEYVRWGERETGLDMYFIEGLIVPEPSALPLAAIGFGGIVRRRASRGANGSKPLT